MTGLSRKENQAKEARLKEEKKKGEVKHVWVYIQLFYEDELVPAKHAIVNFFPVAHPSLLHSFYLTMNH